MGKGDEFWRIVERREALRKAEQDGIVADSMDVRVELMRRVEAGELTLEEAQAELKKIKRGAKAAGKITRNQAYTGR